MITPVTGENVQAWASLNHELWPHHSAAEMLRRYHEDRPPYEFLFCRDGRFVAFMSLAIRHDYVEGAEGPPVAYLEGIYVQPAYRRQGIAAQLVAYARRWGHGQGCRQLASDCALENQASRAFHAGAGFAEVGINVHFLQNIGEAD